MDELSNIIIIHVSLTMTTLGFSTTMVFVDELPDKPAADDADALPIDDDTC